MVVLGPAQPLMPEPILVRQQVLTAFKRVNAGKNNRGVEFSAKMIARLMEAPEFSIAKKEVELDIGGGAITRRMAMLSVLAAQRTPSL